MPEHSPSRHKPGRQQPTRHEPGAAPAGPVGVLTWPVDIETEAIEVEILQFAEIFQSPRVASIQVSELEGEFWSVQWTIPNLQDDRGRASAFISRLRGVSGRAIIPMYDAPQAGVLTGVPQVTGADQIGTSMNTFGWTASTTGIMKAGDFFTVNGELKICTVDANSDGGGAATINFEPFLRSSPLDLAQLEVDDPTIQVILMSAPGWKTLPGMRSNYQMLWFEDVYKDFP